MASKRLEESVNAVTEQAPSFVETKAHNCDFLAVAVQPHFRAQHLLDGTLGLADGDLDPLTFTGMGT